MHRKKLAGILMGLLVLQFALGMLANLYSEIPEDDPAKVFNQFGFISLHVLNGLVILILSIVYLVKAVKNRQSIKEAANALGAIVAAIVFGELFVFTQTEIFSFLMAISFLGALIGYARIVIAEEHK